jgi:hypothetical protein
VVPENQPYSQPFWLQKQHRGDTYVIDNQELIGLAEPPPVLSARFHIRIDNEEIDLVRPVIRRHVDRVDGETSRPLVVVPPVAISIPEPAIIFPDSKPKTVEVLVSSNIADASGEVRLAAPDGWNSQPATVPFRIAGAGEQAILSFTLRPPQASASGELRAVARMSGREISSGMQVIAYAGMPPQTAFPPSTARLVRSDIKILARNIGYVMGAGDEVPRALRQLGCEVTMLTADDLAGGDLRKFDAIVAGVRAYNVRADLRANHRRLLEYVEQGGAYIVQYNVADRRAPSTLQSIGPYPITVGSSRVSVEEAPVTLLNPQDPLLHSPNSIGEEDFRGWIQERGLNFASQWDGQYTPLFESHDPNEQPLKGGTLYAAYGKGVYVFTPLSWFRQLPAGVPGAFRIFANFLSAAKTAR